MNIVRMIRIKAVFKLALFATGVLIVAYVASFTTRHHPTPLGPPDNNPDMGPNLHTYEANQGPPLAGNVARQATQSRSDSKTEDISVVGIETDDTVLRNVHPNPEQAQAYLKAVGVIDGKDKWDDSRDVRGGVVGYAWGDYTGDKGTIVSIEAGGVVQKHNQGYIASDLKQEVQRNESKNLGTNGEGVGVSDVKLDGADGLKVKGDSPQTADMKSATARDNGNVGLSLGAGAPGGMNPVWPEKQPKDEVTKVGASAKSKTSIASPFENHDAQVGAIYDNKGSDLQSQDSKVKNPKTSLLENAGVVAPGEKHDDEPENYVGKDNLCVEFMADTGTRLFQFVSAYAIAKDRNMSLVVPKFLAGIFDTFDFGAKSADGASDVLSYDESGKICKQATRATNFKLGIYDEMFLRRLPPDTDLKLQGYFYSYRYFQHREEEIRDALTFSADILNKAMDTINVLHYQKFGVSLQNVQTSYPPVLVGIHVARIDRVKDEGYREAPVGFIKRAMEKMRQQQSVDNGQVLNADGSGKAANTSDSTVKFYVVCDKGVASWAEDLKKLPDVMMVTGLNWAPRLALLANMDHVILTSADPLGWWGAWLSNGDVIYYQDFLEPGGKMEASYLETDFFPSIWQGMV